MFDDNSERMVYVNLKINKETIRSSEKICDCMQEQTMELDYILPDYYPEIFRIIKCIAEPKITSCITEDDRASYELTVCLKIIYCTEGDSKPQIVDQKLVYNRTVNFDKSCKSPSVFINAVTDHINCRAVNKKRIDIRGAVTIHICAWGETEAEAVCDVFGGDIQLKRISVACPSSVLRAQKRSCISDEFDIDPDTPPLGSIIRSCAEIVSCDKKIIGSKMAVKGELRINILYTSDSSESEDNEVSSLTYSMPFSNLTELEGMDESYECRASVKVVSCDIKPCSEGDGKITRLECEVTVLIDCEAVKNTVADLACDEYSVMYDSSHTCTPLKICLKPAEADGTLIVKGVCENKDSPLSVIYDAWCCTDRLNPVINDGKLIISGNVRFYVMGKAENGDIIICENDMPVKEDSSVMSALNEKMFSSDADARMNFDVISCNYTFSSDNTVEVKAEIAARGIVNDYESVEAVTDISVNEESPKSKNDEYAVRLYFADSGEELWDIAKKYGAFMDRIIDENELEGDIIKEGRMLLIPVA